jgi:hypothetical protein
VTGALRPLGTAAAAAMLSACAVFPWAVPDLADPLVGATVRCAGEVDCGVLTFARDTDLRELLTASGLRGAADRAHDDPPRRRPGW